MQTDLSFEDDGGVSHAIEWGGFFDHVAPPRADAPNDVDPNLVDGKALLGMRIPVVVASPATRGDPTNPRVVSTVFDNSSILKLIEWRWNLKPLTARDASSDVGNLVSALNLANPNLGVPALPNPAPPTLTLCVPSAASSATAEPGLGDLMTLKLAK
jgi:phospholipase C